MHIIGIIFFQLAILLVSLTVDAQPWNSQDLPKFKHITVNEALLDSYVTSISQDHQGFVWFGTLEGLNHFDG